MTRRDDSPMPPSRGDASGRPTGPGEGAADQERQLDLLLDHYPDAPVPEDFASRVVAQARAHGGASEAAKLRPLPRAGGWQRWMPLAAAAALVLALGLGLRGVGNDAPTHPSEGDAGQALAEAADTLRDLPAEVLDDDIMWDLMVSADDETFDAFLEGEFDELLSDAG